MRRAIDSDLRRGREPLIGARPNVPRRLAVERGAIRDQRLLVHRAMKVQLIATALRRFVMQRLAEHIAAEVVPVRPRVAEVEVPRLVDSLRRTRGRRRRRGEEQKSSVLRDDTLGVAERPAVLAGEADGKRGRRRGVVDGELVDAAPERPVIVIHSAASVRTGGVRDSPSMLPRSHAARRRPRG